MRFRSLVLLVAGPLALSACQDEAPLEENADEADRAAKGEVLGGTISDDMIPLDRLRSQSPPVADAPAASQGAGAADQAPSAPAVAEPIDDADDVPAQPDDAGQDSPEG
ncbi:MAG TPA: hypothetical protein DCQ48_14045 [Erythrobacter sp.]|nr:hypothetical protein [Erythrobacter sp.]